MQIRLSRAVDHTLLIFSVFGPKDASKLDGALYFLRSLIYHHHRETTKICGLSVFDERFDRSIGVWRFTRMSRFPPDGLSGPKENNNNNKRSKSANKAAAAACTPKSDRLTALVLLWFLILYRITCESLVSSVLSYSLTNWRGRRFFSWRIFNSHLRLRSLSRDQVSWVQVYV